MQQLARLKFTSFAIKVPQGWRDPSGGDAGDHYSKAFKPQEKMTSPGMPMLFQPATLNKYHTDTQKMHVAEIGKFIDGVCSAICSAWGQWQSLASMTGVLINAVSASLGMVVGPPLAPLILASAPKSKPSEMKYSNVIAQVVGMTWLQYTASIKVPGLPWYPAFAAFPSPVAPPTPNVPVPVAALTQVAPQPALMKQQMVAQLGDPQAPFHDKLFEAICDAFDKCFKIWQTSTMVTNVLGTGPIPTFAPPYVPAGPVVSGVGTMPPGGFV
ncbi:MAG TPA: hypothetical protein VIV40_28080 [Kofleriaceae bacterium]